MEMYLADQLDFELDFLSALPLVCGLETVWLVESSVLPMGISMVL